MIARSQHDGVLTLRLAHGKASALDVELRDPSGAETRLTRAEIEEVRRSETSVIPEGLVSALSREEFRDLLAFLKALR